ncbi:hypothetical protein B5S33_g1055 [[Candida] boidinii]|nr:hypothetical protein B5S27_g1366 [[Candida] boidinii]OWB82429.1 hypothetical protein B5S33_g1055 [[Candida] boidinii]
MSSVHDLKGQLKINNDFISANGNGKPIDSSGSGSGSGSSSGYSTSNSSDIRYLFSPSRSYLKLIEYPLTEPSNTHPQAKYYHFDKDGVFEIPNLQSGKQYELVIESVDFKFKRSNHFKIVVDAGEVAGGAAGGLAGGSAGSESDSPLTATAPEAGATAPAAPAAISPAAAPSVAPPVVPAGSASSSSGRYKSGSSKRRR